MNKEELYQMDTIDWIENQWGNEFMIPVYGMKSNKMIKSYLIPKDKAIQELDCVFFDRDNLKPGFDLGGEEGEQYTRFCNYDNVEPFVIEMDYEGVFTNSIELVEEFRLLFNLFYNYAEHKYISPKNGDIVAKIEVHDDGSHLVCVHKKYLKSYLSVKGMAMILFVNHQLQFLVEEGEWNKENYTIEGENLKYELSIGSYGGNNFTVLNAKKIIYGCPIKDCGIWPYEEKPTYIEFIIGADENGKEKSFTCDPNMLNNMANTHPESPHYLTPVFFQSEVLNKYYDHPKRYKVGDGVLRCGSQWALYIDNHNVGDGYVSVYLGDLGRDLPNLEEQNYWRSYNKLMDSKLSMTKFKRDFLAKFAEPESVDLIFRNKYMYLNQQFEDKKGWKLFIDLNPDDAYNYTGVRIPTNDSVSQFDMLVLSLVKIMIDSLNEKEICKELTRKGVDVSNLKGSISKLEKYFCEYGFEQYESHIKFLRKLQELRSSSVGHRKGKNYEKIAVDFGIVDGNYKKVFADILQDALEFLQYIELNLES